MFRIAERTGAPWYWPWILIGAVLAIFVPAQIVVNEQHRAARDAWRVAFHTQLAKDRIAEKRARAIHSTALDAARRKAHDGSTQLTLADAEQLLNGGAPLATVPEHPYHREWVDPSGGKAYLLINGAKWMFVDEGLMDHHNRGPDPNVGVHGSFMIGRRMTYIGLYFLWSVLAIWWLVAANPSSATTSFRGAMHMFLLACLATLLASLGSGYLRAWGYFFDDDAAGLGLIAMVISAIMVTYVTVRYRRLMRNPVACPECDYDLTANTSGACPECGTPVPPHINVILSNFNKKGVRGK